MKMNKNEEKTAKVIKSGQLNKAGIKDPVIYLMKRLELDENFRRKISSFLINNQFIV